MTFRKTRLPSFGVLLEPREADLNIDSLPVEELRAIFREEQLIVLRGFRTFTSAEGFAAYCARWGEISLWPFGKVLELVEHADPKDHIFDNNYVPLHWDGMYRPQIPEYQIFHCVSAPLAGQAGRTTFSHTGRALQSASPEDLALWSRVTGHYRRKMEFYDSKTNEPILGKHLRTGAPVIRYNEPPQENGHFLNRPELEFSGLSTYERGSFHQSLRAALYAPANFYAHQWESGDVVVADNFTLLHGREGFTAKAPRHLRRVHVLSDPPFDNPGLESHREL